MNDLKLVIYTFGCLVSAIHGIPALKNTTTPTNSDIFAPLTLIFVISKYLNFYLFKAFALGQIKIKI